MPINNDDFSLPRKKLSSDSIKRKFKDSPGSDGIKAYKVIILVLLIVIAIAAMYNTCNNDNGPVGADPVIIDTSSLGKDTAVITPPFRDTVVIPPVVKRQKFKVYGTSLQDLRNKLMSTSSSALMSGNYTPVEVKLNLSTFYASFELEPKPSKFIKLSLLWGPINVGCESCLNSIRKNPGSVQLFSASDNSYEYGIIGIAN